MYKAGVKYQLDNALELRGGLPFIRGGVSVLVQTCG